MNDKKGLVRIEMRKVFCRLIRMTLKISPQLLKNIAIKLPFSRFFKFASWLFWCEDIVRYHNVSVKINPGRLHEYFLYFFAPVWIVKR